MSRHGEHYRFRSELVERLQRDLLGPVGGEEEILSDAPVTTYATGVLFPRRMNEDRVTAARTERDVDLTTATMTVDEIPDTGVSLANLQTPSSMGMTFAVDPDKAPVLTIAVTAAMYEPIDKNGGPVRARRGERRSTEEQDLRWRRRALDITPVQVDVTRPGQSAESVAPGLELRVRVRPRTGEHDAVSVTTALVNVHEVDAYDLQDAHCFFQPGIRATGPEGTTALVERPVPVGADEDEVRVNKLLYRHAPTFAVGHGCAADWEWRPSSPRDRTPPEGRPAAVSAVWTAFVPTAEVLLTDSNPDIDSSKLEMRHLAEAPDTEILDALRGLVDGYRAWIAERNEEADLLEATEYGHVAKEQIAQCESVRLRMESGIRLLEEKPDVMAAFRRANLAMAVQRGRTVWIKAGHDGMPRLDGRWRPFQIAFLLLCLDGIADRGHPDRKRADLLWFPTGGGKTEAYLGLIAFTVFLRRQRKGLQGGGVTALMRYTLRLLTLQQFERAATLICAMEMMRRRNPEELGDEEISLGMWVGRAATPNTLVEAADSLKQLRAGKELQERNPVQLRGCPWCGAAMDAWHYQVDAEVSSMRIFCPSVECEFHRELPVHVVDEMIYRVRPTLVIATVDKFAQIAWRAEVATLFNRNKDDGTPPPELIVQDELHLISGPLGSLVGLYETAIDAAADKPKIIASTATIRRAKEQGRRLFDREVRQFPPAGLDARDSWFAVETPAEDKASRRYVGLLTPGTSQATLLVRAYAALLHHAADIEGEDAVRDAYWTLVGYFNSLRLLAAADLQVRDDVQDRLRLLAERQGVEPRPAELISELTSRVKSSDIPRRLKDLELGLSSKDTDVLDTVLATNMISVGVDVDRLGLMAITGQPQTTAEYIQSSSRVGRQHPGLVVVLFNAARSRDRSHYESFVSYHSALYRQVESTSVTPFSARARDRALHAVLVGMVRLLYPEARPNSAAANVKGFEHRIDEVKSMILDRVKGTGDEESLGTEGDLDYVIDEWMTLAEGNPDLVYEAPPNFDRSEKRLRDAALLCSHSDEDLEEAFPTLWSMRDVDVESDLYLER
ncbi:helicase-related protein [Planomonospora sp. ID82291]|uniref:helicase-related protein n=1 Tax=Planomonospora sp. ID82291 TaxID=2738136 RepID=UPI0018C44674|nr:helicase-related protein [Planomonospora sp. ID82291]MBG0814845.1 DNA helicase [Planomonospora sp. ID82291]